MHPARLTPLIGLISVACADTPEVRNDDLERATTSAGESALPAQPPASGTSHAAFLEALEALCGLAFGGRVVESEPPDPSFEGHEIVMHVRQCLSDEIRIPFFVGENRSRTWVITPTETGLRLKHDHRHEDGSQDDVTQYGGDTRGAGTSISQDFYADAFTADLVPAAANNVWTIEVDPGQTFAYALRREGSDRRFRVEFDLTNPVDRPPPPWGS